jgi:aryl-alcohol dehydrogenase-like predicted oxidoreductase
MPTRRHALGLAANSAAALALAPRLLSAQAAGELNRRPIPASGEQIPVIGLGSSATFSELASADETAALAEVFQTMVDAGGTVFDTAPSYGRGSSEEVAGELVANLGIGAQIFWATKVNVLGFRSEPGARADQAEARAQIETSFERLQADPIDLIQVHNVADMETQFTMLEDYKAAGRARYIGTTTTFPGQYETLKALMRDEPLDFIGIDYAVDNWQACEEQVFPLAQDRGVAVMVCGTSVTRLEFSGVEHACDAVLSHKWSIADEGGA